MTPQIIDATLTRLGLRSQILGRRVVREVGPRMDHLTPEQRGDALCAAVTAALADYSPEESLTRQQIEDRFVGDVVHRLLLAVEPCAEIPY